MLAIKYHKTPARQQANLPQCDPSPSALKLLSSGFGTGLFVAMVELEKSYNLYFDTGTTLQARHSAVHQDLIPDGWLDNYAIR